MEKYFEKDYVIHIEGYADKSTTNLLDKKIYNSVLDMIIKEMIVNAEHSVTEVQKQDSVTYEVM